MTTILDIKGRIAVVTGAGQGVGRQVALYLAEYGAGGVVINDFHLDRAEAVAKEVEALGVKALPLAFDVSDYDAVGAAFDRVRETFGSIDILVNNAGNAGPTSGLGDLVPFWESDPTEWKRWMATNFDGVLNCTRHAMSSMAKSGYGRIVTVISDAGRVGEPHLAVYSGAKSGAAGFMRAIAKAGGRFGINANCVALGGTRTPAVAELIPDAAAEKKALS
ncbi:MAG: SDR family oxidoreductase, partial [Rhodobacteraceae bacterium]|nr:SDR family oxidoreductase [Paracoccaceae bacterium]